MIDEVSLIVQQTEALHLTLALQTTGEGSKAIVHAKVKSDINELLTH